MLGDPAYYGRFGFLSDPGPQLAGVPPECFQCLAIEGELGRGGVTYHAAFSAP